VVAGHRFVGGGSLLLSRAHETQEGRHRPCLHTNSLFHPFHSRVTADDRRVGLGVQRSEVEKLLGPPVEVSTAKDHLEAAKYSLCTPPHKPDLSDSVLVVYKEGIVTEVVGFRLEYHGKPVQMADAFKKLGKPDYKGRGIRADGSVDHQWLSGARYENLKLSFMSDDWLSYFSLGYRSRVEKPDKETHVKQMARDSSAAPGEK